MPLARRSLASVPAEFFMDTSGWFPVIVKSDHRHARLSDILRHAVATRRRAVTTNLVMAETHALLLRRVGRTVAVEFLRSVEASTTIIVHSSQDLEMRARRDWIERFGDQDFSFTDAVSFTVMTDRRMRDAIALDRHFEIAGFHLLNHNG